MQLASEHRNNQPQETENIDCTLNSDQHRQIKDELINDDLDIVVLAQMQKEQ